MSTPPVTFPWRYLFKPVCETTAKSKLARGLCRHWHCMREKDDGRTECPTCRSRRRRVANVERYAYANLKRSAAMRGIPVLLTFDEFSRWCEIHDYIRLRGSERWAMTIDRIDNSKPYSLDNIQPLSRSENTTKGNRERSSSWYDDEDQPF